MDIYMYRYMQKRIFTCNRAFVIHKKTFDAKKGISDIPERAFSWLGHLEDLFYDNRYYRRCNL